MEKIVHCTLEEYILVRIFWNDDLLCSLKYKRVENAHLEFHNILVILQFLVELAMHDGHWNESSKKQESIHLSSPWIPCICPFWVRQQSHWLADFLVHAQIKPKNMSYELHNTTKLLKNSTSQSLTWNLMKLLSMDL